VKRACLATGGAVRARILAILDGGLTWVACETPIVQGTPTSGVLGADVRDPRATQVSSRPLSGQDVSAARRLAHELDAESRAMRPCAATA
jgi:hypothetical protein